VVDPWGHGVEDAVAEVLPNVTHPPICR
jgi:hypothetical protein